MHGPFTRLAFAGAISALLAIMATAGVPRPAAPAPAGTHSFGAVSSAMAVGEPSAQTALPSLRGDVARQLDILRSENVGRRLPSG